MAFIGWQCDLGISTDSGATYPSFGQIEEITLPTFKVTDVRNSNIEMANAWHTFQAGLIEGGQCKFKLIFAKANYNKCIVNLRAANMFKITFSDLISSASTLVWSGYLNELGGTIPLDDKIMNDVGIKISGIVTFTQGT